MIGCSVDMNSWKHSQPQIKRLLQAAKLMGCFVMLETGPPHVHVTIASAKNVYKDPAKVSDGFDPAKLKKLENKWSLIVSSELSNPTFTGDDYRSTGTGTTRTTTAVAADAEAELIRKKHAAATAAQKASHKKYSDCLLATMDADACNDKGYYDIDDCTLLSSGKLKCP